MYWERKGPRFTSIPIKNTAEAIIKNVNFTRFSVSTNRDVCASPLYKFVIQKRKHQKICKATNTEETEKSNSNWMNIFFKTMYPVVASKKTNIHDTIHLGIRTNN